MANDEKTLWGIHAGEGGEADELFRKHSCIAVGWAAMGNLAELAADRDAFKARVAECYHDCKPLAIPGQAGVLFRFLHEMKPDDVIVYPSKIDRQIHLGVVTGPYTHDPGRSSHYPNQRAVRWVRAVPRTSFSQGALYEIGSAITLFQVKNYAEEFLAAMKGEVIESELDGDETVPLVAAIIEQNTRDFVLKTLSQELKGHPLSHFVAHLLSTMGYRTRVSPPGPDSGVDIIAHRDELGFEPPIIKVQVKSSSDNVGEPVVASLYGQVTNAGEHALVVTLGGFTPQARNFAKGALNPGSWSTWGESI